jgi:two-component system, NtrC family, response regulator HupR/HoxA
MSEPNIAPMGMHDQRDIIVVRRLTLKEQVEALERSVIAEALTRHRWNRSRTAEELGLSRVGLANKIRRYGLDGGVE